MLKYWNQNVNLNIRLRVLSFITNENNNKT